MSNSPYSKSYVAGANVSPYRIVKPGGTAGAVVHAAAATDSLLGVLDVPAAVASGQRVDVALNGEVEVELGGAVSEGALVTADASGRAIAAAPAAGSNVRIVGMCTLGGVLGDIGRVLLKQGSMQG